MHYCIINNQVEGITPSERHLLKPVFRHCRSNMGNSSLKSAFSHKDSLTCREEAWWLVISTRIGPSSDKWKFILINGQFFGFLLSRMMLALSHTQGPSQLSCADLKTQELRQYFSAYSWYIRYIKWSKLRIWLLQTLRRGREESAVDC